MSEFDFTRLVPLGQYWPTGSLVHRLDPRARLLGALFLLSGITAAQGLLGLTLALVVLGLLYRLARIPLREGARTLRPALPFLLILVLLQVAFNAGADRGTVWLRLGAWQLTTEDGVIAARLLLRFAALVLTLNLLSFCLADTELVRALEALLHPVQGLLPVHDAVLLVQVTLHFIPLMLRELERIAKAQASRGAEWGVRRGSLAQRVRMVFPLLIPLFLNGLQRSENLALAMEARGYDGNLPRTAWVEFTWHARDTLALGLALGLTIGIVGLS